jgi:hypothetical protein
MLTADRSCLWRPGRSRYLEPLFLALEKPAFECRSAMAIDSEVTYDLVQIRERLLDIQCTFGFSYLQICILHNILRTLGVTQNFQRGSTQLRSMGNKYRT